MPFRFAPLGAILLGLALLSTTGGCKQSTTSSDAPSDSSAEVTAQRTIPVSSVELVDSFGNALGRFGRADFPTATDSAMLRRWTDSLYTKGQSLQREAPDEAREHFQRALQASRVLSDSAGSARYSGAIGETYRLESRFDRALDHYREALRISRALNNRAGIARSLNRIGTVHKDQGRYEEALVQYRESLQIGREVGDRESVAAALNNIGNVHESQGRYEKALARYRESLQIERDLGDREDAAMSSRNIGILRFRRGQYDEALLRAQKSLEIQRELENQKRIARSLNLVAGIQLRKGQHNRALARYREALQINRDLGDQGGVALNLTNMAIINGKQGQHENALSRFKKGLQVYREIGERRSIARTLNNVAATLKKLGRSGEVLARYRESLRLYREMGDQNGVATALNNIGAVYRTNGRYKEALARYRESLQIKRELSDRHGIAKSLTGIAKTHEDQGRHGEALTRYREAFKIRQEVENRPGVAASLSSIGTAHLEAGRLRAATDTLRRAVRLADELRLSATSPDARRSLLSTQIGTYRALTTAHVRSGRPDSALRSVEQARARLLADRLAGTATGDTALAPPSTTELRQTLGPDEAALLYANTRSEWPLTALVVTRDTTVARTLPDTTARIAIGTEYRARLKRLRREDGPLAVGTRSRASSGPDQPPSLAEAIRLYRSVLTREQTDASVQTDLSRRLYDLLVEPVGGLLAEKRELVVVPTGALGYLPFETLRTASGQYVIETTQVRYAQSLTVLRQLQNRTYSPSRRPLLALGGASYELDAPAEDGALVADARRGTTDVATEEHATTLFRNASRRMEQGKSPRPTYRQLGYDQWPRLPGTKLEVQKLARVSGRGARVLTGPAASEKQIRRMSAAGELARYRRVHFATHGMAVPEAPALSALVLSQNRASDSLAAADGYLTMNEIAELNLRADVAVLSACQTGLGKVVAGEGVVSLSHAFLRAGANATLVSQWRVPDWSTQQFMAAVYRRADEEDTSFADATAAVKRAFIAGEFGKENTDPLRWAPFVYYGRE
jgi:tetratricopeptide (TPR) repeat protein